MDADIRDIDAVVNQVVTNPESVSGMTGNTGTTSGILESSDTSGTSGTSGSSGISDTSGAKYWPVVKFTKRQNVLASTTDVYEMSQEMVTRITQNYREYFGHIFPNGVPRKKDLIVYLFDQDPIKSYDSSFTSQNNKGNLDGFGAIIDLVKKTGDTTLKINIYSPLGATAWRLETKCI